MARPGLTSHRKFKRLARMLGSPIVARGALELLWDSCYESGDPYVGTAEDIEHTIGWTGDPGVLAQALEFCGSPEGHGFIEPLDPDALPGSRRYYVHDLWHHAPEYVSKRRKREEERRQKGACPTNGGHRTPNGRTPSPSPSPSPSHGSTESSEAMTPPEPEDGDPRGPSEAREDEDPVRMIFPTIGAEGQEWQLRARQIAKWVELFPTLDVEAELRNALAWVDANRGRRKTGRGMPKFLVGWLTRSTDRGGRHGETTPTRGRAEQYREPSGEDWFEECRQMHGGACGLDQHRHRIRKTIDAQRARTA